MSPLAIAALGLLALAALVGWSWWRKWHRELAAARHTYHAAGQDVEAATVFYGSMNLRAEQQVRGWICQGCGGGPIYGGTPPWCYGCGPNAITHGLDGQMTSTTFLPAPPELDWRERTMAELSPEALDSGPGPSSLVPGPALTSHREDAQGRDVRVCATDSRPAAGADLTGSLSSRPPDEDPGPPAHGGPGLGPASLAIGFLPAPTRLADTGDIRDAALLADTTTYMRDQDADVADWMARRAAEWARLKIGVLA